MHAGFQNDTIAAIATAEGPAGVAVVRISGDQAWQVAARVVRPAGAPLVSRAPGSFFHTQFVDAETGSTLDDGLALLFRAPASFTGEDVVELQGHGGALASRSVLRSVLRAGARLAEPGEFSRRAFLSGRIDLTQAEAMMDLVHARSERAAQAARAQLAGNLGLAITECYGRVTALCADVASLLDFGEDELPARVRGEAEARLDQVRQQVAALLTSRREGHLLRDGALAVIGGCPNAGKSSLLNALLGTDRAIVSSIAGTTRDTIEEGLVLDGIPLRLMDTAGLRDAPSAVEQEGVLRARQAMAQADLVLYVIDASRPLAEQHLDFTGQTAQWLVLLNKCDLPAQTSKIDVLQVWSRQQGSRPPPPIVSLSALTGAGMAELKAVLTSQLGLDSQAPIHPIVAERHSTELICAGQFLAKSRLLLAGDDTQLVLAAGELRQAAEALGRIIGRVYSTDLLDQIFARFCVGK